MGERRISSENFRYDASDQQGGKFFWLYYGLKYDFRRVVVICSFALGRVRLRRSSGNPFCSLLHILTDLYFMELIPCISVLTIGTKVHWFIAERVVCKC